MARLLPHAAGLDVRGALRRTPPLAGRPIRLTFRPRLIARRGKLVSDDASGGAVVHAAAFLRKRHVILESSLLASRRNLSRILVHELFHFAWLRLGNRRRRSWEQLLASEFRRHARGELGWSAEIRKQRLTAEDAAARGRRWREYACESFCDSAAWLFSTSGAHAEYTLAPRHRELRRRWMRQALDGGPVPV